MNRFYIGLGAVSVAFGVWLGMLRGQPEQEMLLRSALAELPVAKEQRTGYDRDAFKHWIDADRDGCSTRAEVLLTEAVHAPQVGQRCALTGGQWRSYYDGADVNDAGGLEVDHLVALAEAWDSGASSWSDQRREDYANDLGDERTLVAVTVRVNRSKSDHDPARWLPPLETAHCRYVGEWIAVKLRWSLSVDAAEKAALATVTESCPNARITVKLATGPK